MKETRALFLKRWLQCVLHRTFPGCNISASFCKIDPQTVENYLWPPFSFSTLKAYLLHVCLFFLLDTDLKNRHGWWSGEQRLWNQIITIMIPTSQETYESKWDECIDSDSHVDWHIEGHYFLPSTYYSSASQMYSNVCSVNIYWISLMCWTLLQGLIYINKQNRQTVLPLGSLQSGF